MNRIILCVRNNIGYWVTRFPSDLSITAHTDTQLELTWVNNGTVDYDDVSIERSTDNVTFSEIDTAVAGSTNYLDTGLTSGVQYYYKVRYSKDGAYSEYTSVGNATTSIVRILTDGNTTAIFDYDETSSITKDGSNLISAWKDFLNQAGSSITATGVLCPTFQSDGILFDGSNNRLKGFFTLAQPEFIYGNLKQITWGSSRYLFDGAGNTTDANKGCVQQFTATPQLLAYAGSLGSTNSNLALDTWGTLRVLFNGASSKIQVDSSAAVTGDFGADNMDGFSIGGFAGERGGGLPPYPANIKVKEFIIRKVADSAANEAKIYNYLKNKSYSTYKTLATPTVVLCFDDGFGRWKSNLLPVLQDKGVSATFFVLCGLINFDDPYPGILAAYGGEEAVTPALQWADLVDMQEAGMDIQAHAFYQHADLTSLTDAQVRTDFDSLNAKFFEEGLAIPKHMSYPGGFQNAHLNNIMWEYFHTARGIGVAYGDQNTNRFVLPVSSATGIDGESVAILNTAKSQIDYAVANTKFVIFYAHDFYMDAETRVNTISTKQFIIEGIIDYAIAQGCNIRTISGLYDDLWD